MQRLYASIERFTNTGRRRRGADPSAAWPGVRERPPSWYVHHGPAPPVQIELLAGSKPASIAASCTRPSSGLRAAGDAARLICTERGETCGMNTHRPIDDLKVTVAKQRALRERLQADRLERESRLSGSSVVIRVRQAMKRPRV